jgi:hypothetical protein
MDTYSDKLGRGRGLVFITKERNKLKQNTKETHRRNEQKYSTNQLMN